MTKLQAIRVKVIEAVPEVMLLVPGCEVLVHGKKLSICAYHGAGVYLLSDGKIWTHTMITQVRSVEVRGRPIRLADVLLATPEGDEAPLLTTEGQFVMYSPEDGSIALSGKWWNLRNDDLEAQSEETIAFIHSLLCV